jgi:hypothetical protein
VLAGGRPTGATTWTRTMRAHEPSPHNS